MRWHIKWGLHERLFEDPTPHLDSVLFLDNEDEKTSIEIGLCDVFPEAGTDGEKAEAILADMLEAENVEYCETETMYSNIYVSGKAVVCCCNDKENGIRYWLLEGVKVRDEQYVYCRICYPTEEYKSWAVELWNSITTFNYN